MSDLTCFINAEILAGDDLEVVRGKALVVEGGRIIAIDAPVPGARTVDLGGTVLCPAFIDAHTHVGDTGAKELGVGLPLAQTVVPPHGLKHRFLQQVAGTESHVEMMRHGLREMLAGGIAAAADFREQGLEGVRALRRASQGLPIRVIALGRITEGLRGAKAEAEACALLAEADGLGFRDVEAIPTGLPGRLKAAYPGKIFAAHASEDRSSEKQSRAAYGKGQTARLAEWGPDFLVHLIHTPAEELRLLADRGVRGVACPRCNGILGSGIPRLAEWARLGLPFALGTDNVMFNSPDMFREMDFASRMTRGFEGDPATIDARLLLQAATIEGARALRLDRDLGSLAPGKEATFLAIDLASPNLAYQQNPISALVHRAGPADIAGFYLRGEKLEGLSNLFRETRKDE
jgi:cytosine/adenosine deaminase-related metal-dependent hydrolase